MASLFSTLASKVLIPTMMPVVEGNLMPDFLIRQGARTLIGRMATEQDQRSVAEKVALKMAYVTDLKQRPLAEATQAANEQHYEVPAAFYTHVMGQRRKYSCGLWPRDSMTLDESEDAALEMVCERAQLGALPAGAKVLDMGCGWGSFSLFAAAKYPSLSFTGVSNSNSQREFIMATAKERGLSNVNIITCDINRFDGGAAAPFDRVVSIEMMEHVKNYDALLERVAGWLKPGGKLFVHIFTHKDTPFHYTDGWMAENFFTGGQMPSDDLLLHFQRHVQLQEHWVVNGKHYERTCNEWLRKMDGHKAEVLDILGGVYGKDQALKRYVDWRLFMIACAELFGYRGGEEWAVSHYLFAKPA